jgi:hypothetical protein
MKEKRDAKATLERWTKTLHLTDDEKQQVGQILSNESMVDDAAHARLDRVRVGGGYAGYGVGYRGAVRYGFGRGYASGYRGAYLI